MLSKITYIFNEENINDLLKKVVNDILDVGVDVFNIDPYSLPLNYDSLLKCRIPANSYIPEVELRTVDPKEFLLDIKTIIKCWNVNILVEPSNKKHLKMIFVLIELYNDKLKKLKEKNNLNVMGLNEITTARTTCLKLIELNILDDMFQNPDKKENYLLKQIEETLDNNNKNKIDILPSVKEFYIRKNPISEKERKITDRLKSDMFKELNPSANVTMTPREQKKYKKEVAKSIEEKINRNQNKKNALNELDVDD